MHIITYYSNDGYKFMAYRLRDLISEWHLPFRAYTREEIEATDFYKNNRKVLDAPRGNGYWAWKSYIILDALTRDTEVMYMDSSVVPKSKISIARILDATDSLNAPRASGYINHVWTKRHCFKAMDCDDPMFWFEDQVWAGVTVAKQSGIPLVREWQNYCLDYSIISDEPSDGNFEGFIEHRHDQSILTNLLIKNSIPFLDSNNEFYDEVQYV